MHKHKAQPIYYFVFYSDKKANFLKTKLLYSYYIYRKYFFSLLEMKQNINIYQKRKTKTSALVRFMNE